MDLFTAKGAIEVDEPRLYKETFPYDDFPKDVFIEGTYPYDIPEEIWVTDTTFRDGQQSMESFTPKQIEDIFTYMHLMDNGNGIIRQSEFFIYNERDREAIERCLALDYEFPQVTTWIRPLPNDIALAAGMGIKETGVLMSCSDYHIFGKLNKNRREVFEMYLKAAADILEKGIRPRCHLEDITRADVFGFVIPLIRALDEMGKDAGVPIKFRLCDTLGVGKPFTRLAIPRSVPALVHHVKEETNVHATQLEWHGHNDYYYAVANSTAAWLHGLSSISTTLLGIGERTGNTPLEAMLVECTQLKQPKNPLNFHALTEIARYFEREFRYSVPPKTPFVGEDFNATKAGIHADGLLKHEDIYNSVDTNKVFNRPIRIAINQFSGNAGIAAWINAEYGFLDNEKITKQDPLVHKIKEWIDNQYASGRNTAISDCEMHFLVGKFIVSKRKGKNADLKDIIIPGGCGDRG